ncbi:hypothetical protein [Acidicapsa ligni]|uniref:hypothetical protein n=1 Tax=Acidicapsa ligni TaxID=542300 RepID=UPI0021E0FA2B|nr:hypothetical protein [Acidicapsa ligni]
MNHEPDDFNNSTGNSLDRVQDQLPDQMLDQILDQAIVSYVSAEPRPGLTQRIHAQIASEAIAQAESLKNARNSHRRSLWQPAFAIAATLAAVATLGAILLHHPISHRDENPSAAASKSPQPIQLQTSAQSPSSTSTPHQPAHPNNRSGLLRMANSSRPQVKPPKPSEEQFARPQFTAQERLLAEFAAYHPEEALATIKSRADSEKPIPNNPISVPQIKVQQIKTDSIVIHPIEMDPKNPITP